MQSAIETAADEAGEVGTAGADRLAPGLGAAVGAAPPVETEEALSSPPQPITKSVPAEANRASTSRLVKMRPIGVSSSRSILPSFTQHPNSDLPLPVLKPNQVSAQLRWASDSVGNNFPFA